MAESQPAGENLDGCVVNPQSSQNGVGRVPRPTAVECHHPGRRRGRREGRPGSSRPFRSEDDPEKAEWYGAERVLHQVKPGRSRQYRAKD